MRSQQLLPLLFRVDQGVMAMKGYFTQEPHHQMYDTLLFLEEGLICLKRIPLTYS